ncbi:hypothetical protein ACFU5N_01705 [Streptomyces albidoflavus]
MSGDKDIDIDIARYALKQPQPDEVVLNRVIRVVEHGNEDVGEHVVSEQNPVVVRQAGHFGTGDPGVSGWHAVPALHDNGVVLKQLTLVDQHALGDLLQPGPLPACCPHPARGPGTHQHDRTACVTVTPVHGGFFSVKPLSAMTPRWHFR